MIYFSKAATNCLFCTKICVPPEDDSRSIPESESVQNEENTGKGRRVLEECDCSQYPNSLLQKLKYTSEDEEDEHFRENLKYAFLLLELMDFPRRKCFQFLTQQRSGAKSEHQEEEDGWFSVCKDCSQLVEEGHNVYHRIKELETTFAEVKKKLKNLINSSEGGTEEDVEEANDGGGGEERDVIYFQVRKHYFSATKTSEEKLMVKVEPDTLFSDASDNIESFNDTHDHESSTSEQVELFQDSDDNEDWAASEQSEEADIKPDLSLVTLDVESDPIVFVHEDKDDPLRIEGSRDTVSEEEDDNDSSLRRKSRRLTHRKSKPLRRIYSSESDANENDSTHCVKKSKPKRMKISSESESEKLVSSEDSSTEKVVEGPFTCSKCGAVYQTKHRLREHVEWHSRDDALECEQCPYVCLTQRGMKIHVTKQHTDAETETAKPVTATESISKTKRTEVKTKIAQDESGEFQCSYCPVIYKTQHRLKEHEDIHEYRSEEAMTCAHCSYVCLLNRGMKIHITKYHPSAENEKQSSKKHSSHKKGSSTSNDLKCKICGTVCSTKSQLQSHLQLHKSKYSVKCRRCPYVCRSILKLKIHTRNVHKKSRDQLDKATSSRAKTPKLQLAHGTKEEPVDSADESILCCAQCPAKYKTEHRYREHLSLHEDSNSFLCPECNWPFSTEENRQRHRVIRHKDGKSKRNRRRDVDEYKCDHCPALYRTRHRFREHVCRHHKDKMIQCTHCGRLFESALLLDIHTRKKHSGEDFDSDEDGSSKKGVINCEQCSAVFSTKSGYNRHLDKMHEPGFPCTVCDAVFPTENRLKFHLARKHEKIHNVCKICGYKSHGKSHLQLHMQKHTKQKMYMCELCSKTFTSPTYLVGHKQREHFEELGLEPIKCDQCDILLFTKTQLKYHNQKVHEKKFNFFCDVCGKGFLFESSAKNHMKVHSTERNEVCQFCGAAYVHNRVLMEHFKHHHPEEYAAIKAKKGTSESQTQEVPAKQEPQGPFICKFCSMEFAMRYHLHSHLKTHTEVYEKYKCETCGKGYSSQAGVKRHEESAHLSGTVACTNCGKEFSCKDYLRYHVKNHCRKNDDEGGAAPETDTKKTTNKSNQNQPMVVTGSTVDLSQMFARSSRHLDDISIPHSDHVNPSGSVDDTESEGAGLFRSHY